MPPLPRHEYVTMGAVCRRSRGMGNEKVKVDFSKINVENFKNMEWHAYASVLAQLLGH